MSILDTGGASEDTRRVLARLGVPDAPLLAKGGESLVFALGNDRVLKVYRGADLAAVERVRTFYAGLAAERLPFALPQIEELGEVEGVCYAIERRMRGRLLAEALLDLTGQARQAALASYLDAVGHLAEIELADHPYGELLSSERVQADSWAGYLRQKIERGLEAAAVHLTQDVPADARREVKRFLDRSLREIPWPATKRLVHGDYWPANVFVDAAGGTWQVSGVIDFSYLTAAGDPLVDVAGAIIFLEGREAYDPRDTAFLLERAHARYGEAIDRVLVFYRLYYSCVFGHCKESDSRTYWWCVGNFLDYATHAS